VHLLINQKHDFGGDQKDCLGGVVVHLDDPIGARKVIDDRDQREIAVTWTLGTQPLPVEGSVSSLLGHEGEVTVTAWLLIGQSGAAVLCDDLPATLTSCPSPSMPVDWAAGNTTPPTDLVNRGSVSVSSGPITLKGSLKADVLYVEVTP
jgi:hypothetical protein